MGAGARAWPKAAHGLAAAAGVLDAEGGVDVAAVLDAAPLVADEAELLESYQQASVTYYGT